ncbi:SPW repeat protein [Streptomyces sp. NPDC003631]|uniref:SPW repeat protein n=1 Tax=Streptomyces lannensis TaxID=766498 RepID=A0ABP7K4T2_9ACTN|nr:SPW repeat protein [Streptomyces sp. WAC07094]
MSYARQPSGMGTHPELAEMRERLERTASSGSAIAIEGLILMAGAYAAISPWVVHFSNSERNLTINNLIIGIAIAMIGLGLTLAPERMFRLAWVIVPLGVWLLISPWVVTAAHGAGTGIIWNNCVVGAVTALLGLAAMGLTVGMNRRRHHTPNTT